MPQTDPHIPAPPRPRFERPREDRVISGVCAGLARHLGLDVALVRTAAVVLALIGGAGLLIYLVVLVCVPEEGTEQPTFRTGQLDADDRAPLIIGALVLGVVVFGAGPLPWGIGDWWDGGPWVLILLLGGALVWVAARREGPVVVAAATAGTEPLVTPGDSAPTTPLDPVTLEHPAEGFTATPSGTPPQEPRPPRGPGVRIVLGGALLALGALGLVLTAVDVDLAWDTALALGVLACGVVALATAPFGGARGVLVLGFLVAAVGGFAAASDVELRGGVGDRVQRPATASAIPADPYRLAIGSLTVDLRDVRFPQGTTIVRIRQGIGETVVRVADDVAVVARARATAGEVVALGVTEDGGSPSVEASTPLSLVNERRVIIDAKIGFGQIRIEQDHVAKGERG